MTKHEIRVIDGIGNDHWLDLEVIHGYHGALHMSMIFDQGKGGHYILERDDVRELLVAIINEMR